MDLPDATQWYILMHVQQTFTIRVPEHEYQYRLFCCKIWLVEMDKDQELRAEKTTS